MDISAESYFDSLFPADPELERVKDNLRTHGMPDISIAPGYGRLLTLLVKMSNAHSVLEIGALGGYSGICLGRGLTGSGRLVSLELREDYAAIAQSNLADAGLGDRVQYMVGDAMLSLRQLEAEGARFDFFFIDADKENYPNYLDRCITLANEGAMIAADNTLLRGRTVNPDKQGPSVSAMREFNRRIAQDPYLIGTHLPAYDGLALARVHKKA
ncbi:methyltransferase [Cohnella kolymensis]|uniref:Methyltransferase n=1 Tax=Cohnella kolymensis TaxID=1590652 RepID=A0ABR5A849_9BACL|nr:O-methyltransferase [Cohnella kolymensis]KIL37246.1 methyltransferase [Cohnella kolymensis]